jgi:hypothetical protein
MSSNKEKQQHITSLHTRLLHAFKQNKPYKKQTHKPLSMYQMTTDQYDKHIRKYSSEYTRYGMDPGNEDYTAFYKEAIDHRGFVDELSQVIHGRKTDPDGKNYLPVNNFVSERYFELVQEEQKIRQFTSPQFGLVGLKKGDVLPDNIVSTFAHRAHIAKKNMGWISDQIGKYIKDEANEVEPFLRKTVEKIRVCVKNYEKGENELTPREIPLKIVNGILYSDRTCIMKFEPSWCTPDNAMSDTAKQFLKHHFGLDIDPKPKESFHTFIIQSLRKRLTQLREEMEKEVVNLDDNHLQCLFLSRKYLFKHLTSLFEMKKDFQFRFKHFTEINAVSGKKVYKKKDFEALKKYYSKGDKKRPLYKGGLHIDDNCGDGKYGYPVRGLNDYNLVFWYYTDKDNKTHRFRFLNSFDYRCLRKVVEKNRHIIQNFRREQDEKRKKRKEYRKQEEEEKKQKMEEKKKRKKKRKMDEKFLALSSNFQMLYNFGVYSEKEIDAFNSKLQSRIDKFKKKRKREEKEELKVKKKCKIRVEV